MPMLRLEWSLVTGAVATIVARPGCNAVARPRFGPSAMTDAVLVLLLDHVTRSVAWAGGPLSGTGKARILPVPPAPTTSRGGVTLRATIFTPQPTVALPPLDAELTPEAVCVAEICAVPLARQVASP